MKFSNQFNEIFFNNLIKHDLTQHEWKVITTFVTDSAEFNISLKEIERRTGIAQPNISRALRGLVFQGILQKENKKYELCEALLLKDYQPEETSSTNMRKEDESTHIKGNGNFAKQSVRKKEKNDEITKNVREMIQKTAAKKRNSSWQSFHSEVRDKEIFVKVEETEHGMKTLFSEDPAEGRISIAPMDIVEEYCRKILKIDDPNDMLNYVYVGDFDSFIAKHRLKRPS